MANNISPIHNSVVSPSRDSGRPAVRETVQAGASTRPAPTSAVGDVKAAAPSSPARESTNVVESPQETRQKLKEALSGLNALVQGLHRELQFTMDEHTGDMKIQVIDKETEEVVREIPPEELQRVRQHLAETAGVIFTDEA